LSAAVQKQSEYVLPARFDDTPVPGLPSSIGYVKIGPAGRSPEALADLIARKLGQLGETVRPPTALSGDVAVTQAGAACEIAIKVTDTDDQPITGSEVAVVTGPGVKTSGTTDDAGELKIILPTRRLVTVMVAHDHHRPGHQSLVLIPEAGSE
jgi:hypothetical protein